MSSDSPLAGSRALGLSKLGVVLMRGSDRSIANKMHVCTINHWQTAHQLPFTGRVVVRVGLGRRMLDSFRLLLTGSCFCEGISNFQHTV
jgi:hypothetical protein